MGQCLEEIRCTLQESYPSEVTQEVLNSSTSDVSVGYHGSSLDSVPKVMLHPFTCMYPNFRFPEGKLVFSINDIICANSLGTVSYSYWFWEQWEPSQKCKFLGASQGPTLKTGLSTDRQSRACCVNSALHGWSASFSV